MHIISIDLGGTKAAFSVITKNGELLLYSCKLLNDKQGTEVGEMLKATIQEILSTAKENRFDIQAIGISVPGIVRLEKGTVWAPKIPGWEDYPLLEEIRQSVKDIPVIIESDRTCYILGETWQGNARNCKDVIYLAIGTGIGAGIITNGTLVKGAHGIGGAVGWMHLNKSDIEQDSSHECSFEQYASGTGMVALAKEWMNTSPGYSGSLKNKAELLTAQDIFDYYDSDELAKKTIEQCIRIWGRAVANLVSIFNPEKIILGGGVFGPGVRFLPEIKNEAAKWAQPISEKLYSLETSALGQKAGVYGAAYIALKDLIKNKPADDDE